MFDVSLPVTRKLHLAINKRDVFLFEILHSIIIIADYLTFLAIPIYKGFQKNCDKMSDNDQIMFMNRKNSYSGEFCRVT